jgi:hypothetical protein
MSDAADLDRQAAERPVPAAGSILRRLWGGEVPLARAFWYYAMIGGTALNAMTTLLAMALLSMDAPAALAVIVFALPIPYNLLVLVAVWRSAGAYQGLGIWADLARAAIVVWAAAAVLL